MHNEKYKDYIYIFLLIKPFATKIGLAFVIQGVHEKMFFPIHCNPSPACRTATHPRKRLECTLTLIDWSFSVQPLAQCWRRRGNKILEKKTQNL